VTTFLKFKPPYFTPGTQRNHCEDDREGREHENADLGMVGMSLVLKPDRHRQYRRHERDDHERVEIPRAAVAVEPSADPSARAKPTAPSCHGGILVRHIVTRPGE